MALCSFHRQEDIKYELDHHGEKHGNLHALHKDVKVEERALCVRTRAASQHIKLRSHKSLVGHTLAEKEAVRGYSSGPGTTCHRAEVRDREKKAKMLRLAQNVIMAVR